MEARTLEPQINKDSTNQQYTTTLKHHNMKITHRKSSNSDMEKMNEDYRMKMIGNKVKAYLIICSGMSLIVLALRLMGCE
jgi:hypothetical protein